MPTHWLDMLRISEFKAPFPKGAFCAETEPFQYLDTVNLEIAK
jgi:hypothetical protein